VLLFGITVTYLGGRPAADEKLAILKKAREVILEVDTSIQDQDGVDYLVMECVEAETLAKRLEKGPLPLEHVLKFGAQIADALDKAHRAGIVCTGI
jgi:serine/threonine protein kinase